LSAVVEVEERADDNDEHSIVPARTIDSSVRCVAWLTRGYANSSVRYRVYNDTIGITNLHALINLFWCINDNLTLTILLGASTKMVYQFYLSDLALPYHKFSINFYYIIIKIYKLNLRSYSLYLILPY